MLWRNRNNAERRRQLLSKKCIQFGANFLVNSKWNEFFIWIFQWIWSIVWPDPNTTRCICPFLWVPVHFCSNGLTIPNALRPSWHIWTGKRTNRGWLNLLNKFLLCLKRFVIMKKVIFKENHSIRTIFIQINKKN